MSRLGPLQAVRAIAHLTPWDLVWAGLTLVAIVSLIVIILVESHLRHSTQQWKARQQERTAK